MSIRIGNSCANCTKANSQLMCDVHNVKVSKSYTCDSFEMKTELKNDLNCGTCAKFEQSNCANPQKASLGMLCSHWAPRHSVA